MQPESFSVLKNYGEDLTSKVYLTDPAIARDEEIKTLMMILLNIILMRKLLLLSQLNI